jgi:NAD(P)H-hydrate epimerase
MKVTNYAHPVLNCQQAKELEALMLQDESAEWSAMKLAGQGIARLLVKDYAELRPLPDRFSVLALIGKGNNGGDALIACLQLLADFPRAQVDLFMLAEPEDLRPLARRALNELEGRVNLHQVPSMCQCADVEHMLAELGAQDGFHLCLDGLLGMSFKAPLREPYSAVIQAVNAYGAIDLRASIDLPSGITDGIGDDALHFNADFTYATGIAKQALFRGFGRCGRVRYVDLSFFKDMSSVHASLISTPSNLTNREYVLTEAALAPVRRLRPSGVDKRSFGHLFIVGGSAYMPGALLMAVQAAVRSGVGLVTAFAPASVAAVLAAQVPEAMWIPWPETTHGTLSPRAVSLLLDRVHMATAVLVGPGMGKDRNTEMLTQEIVKLVEVPVLLDADALRARVMSIALKRRSHFGRVVLTPHMGEFLRIAKLSEADYTIDTLAEFSTAYNVLTVLKGVHTRICDGESILYNLLGGPVLSRGGSGDILAGLIGGMIAQDLDDVPTAVARGVLLHGIAAELLAQDKGQVAVHTTQVLDYLPQALRR